ncbi:MAG: sigma-70 family RNA polymerase sigma factor [bacterium]|nr:sigma-70 family RNA polymerase sigma factor [bacterium]
MPSTPTAEVTRLLNAWSNGDRGSAEQLAPLIYDELHHLAGLYLARERKEHTLQPTALVHEAYLRLVDLREIEWRDRAHFFAIAAQAMRRILVDHARKHRASKRGGSEPRISLDQAGDLATTRQPDLVVLDDALQGLTAIDPQKASIVELRFFGGLSNEEVAEVLGVSRATVVRRWRMAKAWLHHELSPDEDDDS